jgi:predicted Zn-dependent protease
MAGGEIYVYSGLLLEADSEAEVMAVMSHEVAHVTERHVAKQMLAAYGTKFAPDKAAEKLGDAANGQADEVIDFFVKRIATQGAIAAYGRKQETDADTKGVAYMSEAGYDPNGFIDFFQKLQKQAQGVQLFSSHPPREIASRVSGS